MQPLSWKVTIPENDDDPQWVFQLHVWERERREREERERGPMCICDVKCWKWRNGTGPVQWYLCISQYEIQCSGLAVIYAWLMGGPSVMHICPCFYMWNLFGVVVLHGSMINWQGGPSDMHICACFYMWKLLGVVVLHGSMIDWWGASAMHICAFFYMWNLFGEVVLHGSMNNWWGVHLPCISVHASICVTYLV